MALGRKNTNTGGTIPPHAAYRERAIDDTGSSSAQMIATSAQPSLFECQILQMLTDMKEHMKEQQVWSNHDQEQVILDRENTIRKHEALRQLNDQFQTQIVALQGTQAPSVDKSRVRET